MDSNNFETPGTMGSRIRALRRQLNLRQGDLANAVSIKQAYLSDIENDKRTCPQPSILSAIASLLGTTIDYLVDGKTPSDTRQEPTQQTYLDFEKTPEIVWVPVYEDYVYSSGNMEDAEAIKYEPFVRSKGLPSSLCGLIAHGNSMSDAGIKNGATVIVAPCIRVGNGQPAAVLVGQNLMIRYKLSRGDGSVVLKAANPSYGDEILSKEQTEDKGYYQELGPVISVRYQPDWV